MKKVIVFGDLPIATEVAKFLNTLNDIELVGVVSEKRHKMNVDPFSSECLYDYAKNAFIPVYRLAELPALFQEGTLDYGLTVRYAQILRKPVLRLFREKVLNFHGGLLPEFAGLYSSCHTLLTKSPVAGGTLHLIEDETIDSGEIVKRCEFEVLPDDTSESIFQKTQLALYHGFCEIAEDFFNGITEYKSQESYRKEGYQSGYYSKDSLQKELMLDDKTKEMIAVHARGFEFSEHERGYIVYNNQKIYFTTKDLKDKY